MESKGLLEYEEKKQITPAFVNDYQNLCLKIYRQWRLRIDFEDFYGYCIDKLMVRISSFDPSRSNIGNYVYNLILNEARRIFSSEKHLANADFDEVCLYQEVHDYSLVTDIWEFAQMGWDRGVYVNQEQLLADYQRQRETPAFLAFCWLRAKGAFNAHG